MAFENVFRGIDFDAPNRAARADQKMLMQQIGMGIANYQKGQDRQLQQKQLDIKAAEKDAFNLKAVGQQALYELNLGAPATPERVAAAQAYSQTQTPAFNPISGRQAPSAFEQAMGQTKPISNPQRDAAIATQSDVTQVAPLNFGSPVSQYNDIGDMTAGNALVAEQAGIEQPQTAPQIPMPSNASPKTQQATEEANVDLQKQYAEQRMKSLHEGQVLNKASIKQQSDYEANVDKLLKSYEKLIKAGGAVQTLTDDYTVDDVFSNISARLGASTAGRVAGGAVGTQAEAARQDIATVLPLMFGELRTLMGLTGKEVDTQKERDFYLKALTDDKVNIKTNLENIRGLSTRFGNGETAKKVDRVMGMLKGGGSLKSKYGLK